MNIYGLPVDALECCLNFALVLHFVLNSKHVGYSVIVLCSYHSAKFDDCLWSLKLPVYQHSGTSHFQEPFTLSVLVQFNISMPLQTNNIMAISCLFEILNAASSIP